MRVNNRNAGSVISRSINLLFGDENTARWETVKKIIRNPNSRIGLIMIGILILVGIFAPFIAPYDPYKLVLTESLEAPSLSHPIGIKLA